MWERGGGKSERDREGRGQRKSEGEKGRVEGREKWVKKEREKEGAPCIFIMVLLLGHRILSFSLSLSLTHLNNCVYFLTFLVEDILDMWLMPNILQMCLVHPFFCKEDLKSQHIFGVVTSKFYFHVKIVFCQALIKRTDQWIEASKGRHFLFF